MCVILSTSSAFNINLLEISVSILFARKAFHLVFRCRLLLDDKIELVCARSAVMENASPVLVPHPVVVRGRGFFKALNFMFH